MSAESTLIVVTTVVVCCLAGIASAQQQQYPTCGKNEILSPTPVCCEPTCTNDCSKASFPENYVNEPVCVCKPGYVRHKGRCIRRICCPKNETCTETPASTSTTEFIPRYNEKPKAIGSCPCRRKLLPKPTTTRPYEPPKPPTYYKPEPPTSYDSSSYGPDPYFVQKPSSFAPDPTSFTSTHKPFVPQAYGVYPNLRPFIYNGGEGNFISSIGVSSYESPPHPVEPKCPPEVYTTTSTTEPEPFYTKSPPSSSPEPPVVTPDLPLPKPCAPKCNQLQTLSVCRPCCIPTCENDCSDVRCSEICIAELNCICLAGYVLHNGKCIRKEDCPAAPESSCDKSREASDEGAGYRRTGYTPRAEYSAEVVGGSEDDCNDYPDH